MRVLVLRGGFGMEHRDAMSCKSEVVSCCSRGGETHSRSRPVRVDTEANDEVTGSI